MLPKIVQANLAIIRGLRMMSPPARLIIRSLTHSLGCWLIHCSLRNQEVCIHMAAVDRSDRSVDRAIGSIDSIDSIIFRTFRHTGELENCLVSKFQLCTTLGG